MGFRVKKRWNDSGVKKGCNSVGHIQHWGLYWESDQCGRAVRVKGDGVVHTTEYRSDHWTRKHLGTTRFIGGYNRADEHTFKSENNSTNRNIQGNRLRTHPNTAPKPLRYLHGSGRVSPTESGGSRKCAVESIEGGTTTINHFHSPTLETVGTRMTVDGHAKNEQRTAVIDDRKFERSCS